MEIYEEIRADREMGARRLVAEYRPRLETAARLLCANLVENVVYIFPHSTIAVCLVQHISVGSIHVLKEIITPLPCPL